MKENRPTVKVPCSLPQDSFLWGSSEIAISGFHFFVADGQVLQGKSFKRSWMIDGILPMMCLINLVCFCPLAHVFTCR